MYGMTIEELEAENQGLREQLAEFLDPTNAKLFSIGPEGEFQMESLTLRIMSEAMAQGFACSGAVNVMEFKVEHPEIGWLTYNIQRDEGKTPITMMQEAKEEAKEWERRYHALKAGSIRKHTIDQHRLVTAAVALQALAAGSVGRDEAAAAFEEIRKPYAEFNDLDLAPPDEETP